MSVQARVMGFTRSAATGGSGATVRMLAVVAGLAAVYEMPSLVATARTLLSPPADTWQDVIARADVDEVRRLMLRETLGDVDVHAPTGMFDTPEVQRAARARRIADKELRLQALRIANGVDVPVGATDLGGLAGLVPSKGTVEDEVERALAAAIVADPADAAILTALRNAHRAEHANVDAVSHVMQAYEADQDAPAARGP